MGSADQWQVHSHPIHQIGRYVGIEKAKLLTWLRDLAHIESAASAVGFRQTGQIVLFAILT